MFRPRNLAYAAGAVGVGYVTFHSMSDFKTQGVRNIEASHNRAGGADSHTPAMATKRGDTEAVEGEGVESKGM